MNFLDFMREATLNLSGTSQQRITTLLEPQKDFLYANINEWNSDAKYKEMLVAQRYYTNENDIVNRKRYYIDRKGVRQEAVNLSNSKLVHPFMRKLTNQKVNHLLGKELSLQCDNQKFSEFLSSYFDIKFLAMLKRIGKDAIVNGITWAQAYYDANGILKFKRHPSHEIKAFWADADHTTLDAIIRRYEITEYLPDGVKKDVTKIEYYTSEGVWYYILGDKGLKDDPDRGGDVKGHFIVQQDMLDKDSNPLLDEYGEPIVEKIQAVWDRVPFIPFKYNSDEISLLRWIKPMVDDYDLNTSETSNNLMDIPNSIKVVKGYDGTDKNEWSQNLAIFRTAFVGEGGDLKSLETKLDVAAIDSHLDRLRKDIYEAGNGVDTQEVSLGNASGVALRFRYVDLTSDVGDMALEFSAALKEALWFIKVDLLNKGFGDFMNEEVEIVFNTDSIVNETEVIEDAMNSVGLISDETIVANHPWVTDTKAEIDRIKKEKAVKLAEMQAEMREESQFAQEPTEDEV